MFSTRTIGILQVIASGIGYGFLGIFGKFAFALGVTSGELLSLRFLVGALTLGLLVAAYKPRLFLLSKKELVSCFALGAFGFSVIAICYFKALEGISASLTVLLLYTYPVLVSVGAWVLFSEPLRAATTIALPVVMGGIALLVWGDMSIPHPMYVVLGLGSSVAYATYILASSRLLARTNTIVAAVLVQASAGIILGAFYLHSFDRLVWVLKNAWVPVIGLAVVCSILPMILFLRGLQKLKSAEVSILSTAEPVTAIIAAAVLLGERLSAVQIAGAVVVIVSLLAIAKR